MTLTDSRNTPVACLFKQQGVLTRITPGEKVFLIRNITDLGIIDEDKNKALNEAAARYPRESLHNGIGDAFRHCYLTALLTRDIGEARALELTNLHEDFCGNPEDERTMDLHNNSVGAELGRGLDKSFPDASLADMCATAASSGRLKMLK